MPIQNLDRILAEPLFTLGMKENHLEGLVGSASAVRFNAGEFILREGHEAKRFRFGMSKWRWRSLH